MLGFFKKIAPWLAAGVQFIPGAGPVIAGTINQIAQDTGHTTVKADGTVDSIANAVAAMSGNTDALLKLKQADQDYAKQMKLLDIQEADDIEKIFAADRADARQMQTQTRSKTAPMIAAVFVIGFFIIVGLKIGHVFTSDQTIDDLITTLRDGLMLILAYYFGSSSGSDRKTELLAQAEPIRKQ